jgi:subfamily B ATP-binding cassette protein MsbA
MVELITAFAIALLLYVGGQNVISGEMKQGELLAFFAAFALMMNPIRTMNDMNMKLHAASAACQRIFEIFEWKSTLLEHSDPKKKESFDAEIEFRDVHFAYPDEPAREILKGISFRVPKNRTVALVGASGAGKSSLVTLLPRIFDVTGGTIFLDGNDIREIELSSLRRMISVVSQDVFLFNDTIEENIRCGRLEATSEEIFDAAKHAYAWDFIQKLPQGMSTKIGDRGQKLSGGERQRLSIARAFLRGSPILILDEATSSLDSASERAVQQALQELMQNRTTIVIAHRLSTIRNANEILVLDGGLIVEQGTHSTLLEKNGAYARFLRQNEQEPPITA